VCATPALRNPIADRGGLGALPAFFATFRLLDVYACACNKVKKKIRKWLTNRNDYYIVIGMDKGYFEKRTLRGGRWAFVGVVVKKNWLVLPKSRKKAKLFGFLADITFEQG